MLKISKKNPPEPSYWICITYIFLLEFFASDVLESDDVEGSNDSSDICIHRSPQDMANFAAVLGVRGGLQCVSEVWPTCAV